MAHKQTCSLAPNIKPPTVHNTQVTMTKKKEVLIKISMVILFMFGYGIIGNFIIYPIFIHDECYYHGHETTTTIELLFDFPAYNGYHPVISKLGYLLSASLGFFIGSLLFKFVKFKKKWD